MPAVIVARAAENPTSSNLTCPPARSMLRGDDPPRAGGETVARVAPHVVRRGRGPEDSARVAWRAAWTGLFPCAVHAAEEDGPVNNHHIAEMGSKIAIHM